MRKQANERDQAAMELLIKSGIISEDVSVAKLVQIGAELNKIAIGTDELASWTFITPGYVYTGDRIFGEEIAIERAG
jgi:hypothetical protein